MITDPCSFELLVREGVKSGWGRVRRYTDMSGKSRCFFKPSYIGRNPYLFVKSSTLSFKQCKYFLNNDQIFCLFTNNYFSIFLSLCKYLYLLSSAIFLSIFPSRYLFCLSSLVYVYPSIHPSIYLSIIYLTIYLCSFGKAEKKYFLRTCP